MVHESSTKIPADPDPITCLDDVPELSRSRWQQQIARSYLLAALIPFAVARFIILLFFPHSTSRFGEAAIFLTLGWTIVMAADAFYSLFWSVRGPVCGSAFEGRDSCRSLVCLVTHNSRKCLISPIKFVF